MTWAAVYLHSLISGLSQCSRHLSELGLGPWFTIPQNIKLVGHIGGTMLLESGELEVANISERRDQPTLTQVLAALLKCPGIQWSEAGQCVSTK